MGVVDLLMATARLLCGGKPIHQWKINTYTQSQAAIMYCYYFPRRKTQELHHD
jgi:hypothetical protein